MRGEPQRRDLFFETDDREYTYNRGVMTPDGRKLIVTMENNSRELYDLTAVPGEKDNPAGAGTDLADALERKLYAHFRGIGHDIDERVWRPGFNPVYT